MTLSLERQQQQAEEARSRFERKCRSALAHIKLRPGGLTSANLLTILGGNTQENRLVLNSLKEQREVVERLPSPLYTTPYFYPAGHKIRSLPAHPRQEEQPRSLSPVDPAYPADFDLHRTEKIKAVAKSFRPIAYSHRVRPQPAPSPEPQHTPERKTRQRRQQPEKAAKPRPPQIMRPSRSNTNPAPDVGEQILQAVQSNPGQSAWGIYAQIKPRPGLGKFNRALAALERAGAVRGEFCGQLFVYQLGGGDCESQQV